MKIYNSSSTTHDEIVNNLINAIEEDVQQKIFTLRITDNTEEYVEMLIVFEDKSMLKGRFFVTEIDGYLAIRVQGDYI